MISGMLSPRFAAAILVLILVLSGSSVSSQEVIRSISGRDVPVHLIQAHFDKPLTPSDHTKNIIYELTDENIIQGPDLHIDLKADVRTSVRRISGPRTVTLNGKPRKASSLSIKTLRAKSYSIFVDDESGKILSVTGNGIVLAPLHKTELPGIFVNKGAFSKRTINLADDVRLINESDKSSNDDDTLVAEYDHTVAESRTSTGSLSEFSMRQTGSCASGTTHFLEIAIAYDNTLCAMYNDEESMATAAVAELVDQSNVPYGMNTCIQLALTHVEAHCNDPNDPYAVLSNSDSQGILDGFQQIWINSRGGINRDAAYLVTGFMDGTSTLGVAYVRAACSRQFGYGWVEGARTAVFAHEVGHTVGGTHTNSGIMSARLGPNTAFVFEGTSAVQFADFVDNRGGSTCMSTTAPPSGPGGTSSPPTTTVITTTPPPTPARTCASGFNRRRALRCRGRRLQRINFTLGGEPVGRLTIILTQRSGSFIVNYRATQRLFLARFRDVVSTDSNDIGNLGDFVPLTGRVKRVRSPHDANSLPLPSGFSTCCRRDLFIGSDVQVCLEDEGRILCQTVMDSYTNVVSCTNACRNNPGGVFTPMSENQECPSCV